MKGREAVASAGFRETSIQRGLAPGDQPDDGGEIVNGDAEDGFADVQVELKDAVGDAFEPIGRAVGMTRSSFSKSIQRRMRRSRRGAGRPSAAGGSKSSDATPTRRSGLTSGEYARASINSDFALIRKETTRSESFFQDSIQNKMRQSRDSERTMIRRLSSITDEVENRRGSLGSMGSIEEGDEGVRGSRIGGSFASNGSCGSASRGGLESQLSIGTKKKIVAHAKIAKQLRSNFMFLSLDDEVISELAMQFEVVEYSEGEVIIEQGKVGKDEEMYFYCLIEGGCTVVKDGKKLPGSYGTLVEGSSFGEQAILFDQKERGATIIASRASKDSGVVVLYRLDGAIFKDNMDKEELAGLRERIKKVMKVFDTLVGIDTKIKKKGTIIRPYNPSAAWLIMQWRGTIMQYVWRQVVLSMVFTAVIGVLLEHFGDQNGVGNGLDIEDPELNSLFYHMELIAGWWSSLQPLATFVATFFLGEAFAFWRSFYWITRDIQARFDDISLVLASVAARDEDDGGITAGARGALGDVARIQRLLHKLFWSAVVKRFNALHSPEGLSYLLSFRLITQEEFDSLINIGANQLGGHHAAMTWLTTRIHIAQKRGEIEAGDVIESIFEKITSMRTLMAKIPQMYDGRMPLAYVSFVGLLVNTLTCLSPIALFPKYYYWSIPAVGVLSLFYNGIFTLSLMFLDPVDNDSKHRKFEESAGVDIGVLIRESNAQSVRFEGCAHALPNNYL